MGRRGTIIIMEGTPASATSHLRFAGFQDALAEHKDIAVRCSLQGEYQRTTARDVFLAAKDQWPGIDAVLCANDAMALGVLDALAQAKSGFRPLIVGVNAIPEAVAAIASGQDARHRKFRRHGDERDRDRGRRASPARRARAGRDHAAGAGDRCWQLREMERAVRGEAEPGVG